MDTSLIIGVVSAVLSSPVLVALIVYYFKYHGRNSPRPSSGGNSPRLSSGGNSPHPSSGGNSPRLSSGGNSPPIQPVQPSPPSPPIPPHPMHPPNSGQLIIARDLEIDHLRNNEYWKLVNDPSEPRFKDFVVLLKVWSFSIKTSMSYLGFLYNTNYGVYLIFKTKENSIGLNAMLNVTFSEATEPKYVCLKPNTTTPPNVGSPVNRADQWMELELGQFYCDEPTGEKVASIIIKDQTESQNRKTGLIIAGIEFRPI